MEKVYKVLKPGGLFILTVDLFLDIEPFTRKTNNVHGSNMNIRSMIHDSGFILEFGEPSLLYGFNEFTPENVLANLSTYLYGTIYPALAQCFILKKPVK